MPKDSRASDNVPVLTTAPSCDKLSGVSDLKWSYSEHRHGRAVITGVLCIKYSCWVVVNRSSRAEPGHLGVPGQQALGSFMGRNIITKSVGVDSVVYRTAAAADISSSRSIHVRSAIDSYLVRHAGLHMSRGAVGGCTNPRH